MEEIWELDYAPNFTVPLFRYQWVKMTSGGVTIDKKYGITTMDLNNIGYKDEPYILATDVTQEFYMKDISTKSKREKNNDNSIVNEPKRHIVLSGKRNIVKIENKLDMSSEDYERDD